MATRNRLREVNTDEMDLLEISQKFNCQSGTVSGKNAVLFTMVPDGIKSIVEKKMRQKKLNGEPVNITADIRIYSENMYQVVRRAVDERLQIKTHFGIYVAQDPSATPERPLFSLYAVLHEEQ